MRSEQIRSTFLDYFRGLDHLELPPGPLVPAERDLLFTNAGMVQFKPYFQGVQRPPGPRLMTAQPCVRTVDIDRVGLTDRHATTFEMLGNFAFADYFKREAMAYALDLLTTGFGLERDRLWMTVLHGDEESVDLWLDLGVPAERIQRLGPDDNFWSMGVPGPSGPTSEIFYDRGPSVGRDGGPAVDSERFVELWNLVFMQYQRGESDEEILGDLPGRHIDTGLGRDRLAMVLQGARNLQETDLVRPTLRAVREATGRDDESGAHRLVTDHLRTAVRLIATGVRPGNEGRGYVVRRLLRRAVRRLVLLGVDEPVLGAVADSVTEVPVGVAHEVVEREERAFRRTLRAGNRLLDTELARGPLRGETVFKLHDTYGFPVDLTVEIARESGVSVDIDGFEVLMREHRERSRVKR